MPWKPLLASLVTMAMLFCVLDASRLTAWSIRQLAGTTPIWPHAVVKEYKEKRNMAEPDLNAWLTIKFIGMLTSSVGKLIYYPFIALALLIGARSRYFDDWDFPLELLIMFGVNVTYAMTSAFVLRAVAEQARTAAIERARERLIHVKGEKENTDAQAEQIQMTIEEIENNREGAFAPFLYQPAFGAFLIPSGGIGLLALMEYFVQGK